MISLLLTHVISTFLALVAGLGFWGIGRTCRRRIIALSEDGLIALFDFGIGAWLTWTIIFLIGLVGGYRPALALTILSISTLVAVLELASVFKLVLSSLAECFRQMSKYELLLSFLCTLVILSAFVGALTPAAAQDALVHHLALPKDYIKAGRIVELPYNYFSYFPAAMEMLFLYGLLLKGSGTATLLHLFFGLGTFFAILAGAKSLNISKTARLLAGTAFLTIPTVWMEMTWAYVDLALTFYIVLALIALLKWRESQDIKWSYLLAVALGAALSVKYTTLFAGTSIPLLVLLMMREQKQTNLVVAIKYFLTIGAIILAFSVVWFVRNIIWTGNPLFPFLLNIIPSHNIGWDVERAKTTLAVLSVYGGDKSLKDYLLLPFKLSFLARYESMTYYQGIIGPFYLLVLPVFLLVRRVRTEALYLLGFAIVFYFFWAGSSQQIRYLLPIFPVLSLVIALVYDQFATKELVAANKFLHNIFLLLVTIIFLSNVGIMGYYFSEFKYGQLFTGKIAASDYLRNKFDYYIAYEYINEKTPLNSKIFLIDTSNQPYYLERDYFGDAVFEHYTLANIVKTSKTPEEIKKQIQAKGITHILYRQTILLGPQTTPFNEQEKQRFIDFLFQQAQPLVLTDTIALFSIKP